MAARTLPGVPLLIPRPEPPDPRDELDEEIWVNRVRKRTQRSIRDRHAVSRASGSWKGESDLTAKQTEG